VIKLLASSRRNRKLLGTGLCSKFANLIRNFIPYDDVNKLATNFNLTDLHYCTFSRSIIASSYDAIFRFDDSLGCWILVWKFDVKVPPEETRPTITIDNNGDIYFQLRGLIYILRHGKNTATQVRPRGSVFTRVFSSVQCTGGLCVDTKSRKLFWCLNNRINSMGIRKRSAIVKVELQLQNKALFVAVDDDRELLYCSDVCGAIYMVNNKGKNVALKFNNQRVIHGIVFDPILETLLVHNGYIETLEPDSRDPETLTSCTLRRVCPTVNYGDVLTLDLKGERLFFVESRPTKTSALIRILKFR